MTNQSSEEHSGSQPTVADDLSAAPEDQREEGNATHSSEEAPDSPATDVDGTREDQREAGNATVHSSEESADPHPTFVNDVSATREAPPAGAGHQPMATASQRGRRMAIIAGALLLIVAVVIALALTVFSTGDEAEVEYRGKVNAAIGDVVSANRSLSSALQRLGSRRSPPAERAAERAESATTSARGAVNALTVPPDSEQLAKNARQTLSREAAYVSAVADALANPRGGSDDRVQTLAGNLTDAFDVVAPADADWSQSVSGADNLAAWARRNVLASQRARRRRAAARERPAPGRAQRPAAPAAPTSSGSDCGGGVRAGPNTSCPFAFNVRDAYNEAPGASATVEVFSPTTARTYTMSCAPAGNGITCSGGNNASVSFGG